jgi:hypothetical protein
MVIREYMMFPFHAPTGKFTFCLGTIIEAVLSRMETVKGTLAAAV